MQETNILLVEDDRMIIENLTEFLKTEGFQVWSADGQEKAMKILRNQHFDLILLDITLAQGNGYSTCTQIKSHYEIPIIFLTALDDEFSVVTGLDMGADDYLPKPFAMKELLARIRAMTRRKTELEAAVLEYQGLTLDRKNFELGYKGQSVRLGNKEFQMMELMMRSPGQFISAEQFMEKIWGFDAEAEVNVVWVYLSYLRKKLQGLGAKVEIRAARGIGYRLELTV